MTAEEMAMIHAAAFTKERPWKADEFVELLASPFVETFDASAGFALVRTVADEAELLTIAVHPDSQRGGIAQGLLDTWLDHTTARIAFLEVAADNTPARRLYERNGFAQIAVRPGYYSRKHAGNVDAVIMNRTVTFGQSGKSSINRLKIG